MSARTDGCATMDTERYRSIEDRWWDTVGVTPNDPRVDLQRLDSTVRVQEVGEGEPVVFVHGAPNAGATWGPVLPGLENEYQCLLVDRPGTGLSDPLSDGVDIPTLGDALVVDVLDAFEIGQAHLVASSFGGYVAIRSAAAHPDRIGRTVQMGCPGFVPGMDVPLFMRLSLTPILGRLLDALPPSETSTKWILRQIGHGNSLDGDGLPDGFVEWYTGLARHTDTTANDGALMRRAGSVRGFDPALTIAEETFGAVESPTCFLWGKDDAFGDPRVARRTIELLPDAELELLEGAGHLPWLDDPDHATAVTRAFLGE